MSVLDTLGQWESDLGVMELLDLGPTAVTSFYDLHFDDLDGVCSGTVTGSHIAVALGDCTAYRQISVFTVHVVCTRTGVIPQPDSKVLDLDWGFLCDLKVAMKKY